MNALLLPRRAVVLLVGSIASTAAAEPCPPMGLVPEVVVPDAQVTTDGGIVVMEQAKMLDATPVSTLAGWKLRGGRLTSLAPGLHLVKQPPGAWQFAVEEGGKVKGSAKVVAKPPPPLAAPSVRAVTSGSTRAKHVTRFVTVALAAPAPAQAVALVITDDKGAPLSWGRTHDGANEVTVYTTLGGCMTQFPDGTRIAQPSERVTAFWVDAMGRKSPVSAVIAVKAP